ADRFVLVQPQGWDSPHYDQLRQELTRTVLDSSGRGLTLWLPFSHEDDLPIRLLETHVPKPGEGVFGRLQIVSGQIVVQPISIIRESQVLSLTLPDHRTWKSLRSESPPTISEPDGEFASLESPDESDWNQT